MGDEELAKDLGPLAALTIGVGTMIGAGIFVLPGVAAREAGPIVVASFAVGGAIALVNALSVSELGTAMPKAGGGYYYINRALGPLFGSIAGMGDWMGLAFASAFYTIGFGQYLATLAPVPGVLFLNEVQVGAVLAGAFFVGVNYVGAKETGGVQTVIVTLLLGILGVFALAGWFSFDYGTLVGDGGWTPFGTGAILPGTALVFVSFLGYAKIATVAEELKNPGRNLPLAVIGSVAFVTTVYVILVTAMLGVVPWPELDLAAPVANAARVAFPASITLPAVGPVGGIAVAAATAMTLGALLATASSANASILASARINFAMGRDGLVTDWLNEIHPRFATPYRSIYVTGLLIVAFVLVLGRDIAVLAKAASVLHLIVYALMNVALVVFREADVPEYDPDFRVPLYPLTPVAGAVLSLGLVAFMAPVEIALSAGFVLLAVAWYVVYARRQTDQQGHLGRYILQRAGEMPDVAVSAATAVQPDGGDYRVMVALANPDHERDLVELGASVAKQRDGRLIALHVVQVPDQTPLAAAADHVDGLAPESETLMAQARADARELDVEVETHTVLSHRSIPEVYDAAREYGADLVVMGWGEEPTDSVLGGVEEVSGEVPCDFLVLRDGGFDPERVLVPTAGGPSSDLSASVARLLREEYGSAVTLLHVADEESEGERFLSTWAEDHGLADARRLVQTGGLEAAVRRAAADHTLVIIGATERGVISRLVSGSPVLDALDEIECSVVLAEKRHPRSLWQRLFG